MSGPGVHFLAEALESENRRALAAEARVKELEAQLEKVREWHRESSEMRPVDVGMDALLDILELP